MRARPLAALTAAALAAAACGSATPAPRAAASCTGPGDHRLGTALLHVPPRPAGARPLVLAFHGAGGEGPGFADFSGLSEQAQWARRDGCRATPLVSRPRRDVQRVRHPGCADGLEVQHLRLEGEGHGWYPGTAERVWRFFAGKRLR